MRRVVLFFAVLSMASAAQAQSTGVVIGGVLSGAPPGVVFTTQTMPVVYPVSYGYSTSAFDREGNLLVMDVMYKSDGNSFMLVTPNPVAFP